MRTLAKRFEKIFNKPWKPSQHQRELKISPKIHEAWWKQIETRLNEKHRVYHNASHLEQLYRHYDKMNTPENEFMVHYKHMMDFLIFFHDLIYEIGSKTNESDSAKEFENFAKNVEGLYEFEVQLIKDIIKATANHMSVTEKQIEQQIQQHEHEELNRKLLKELYQTFLDWDMSIIGESREIYSQYSKAIRKEYTAVVDKPTFEQKRAQFLHKLVETPNIYQTAHYQQYQIRAKQNIAWELRTQVEKEKKLIIGVTGGICAGKSTGRQILEKLGATLTIDADKVGHTIYNHGKKAYHEIIETFGNSVVDETTKEINRKALGAIVFSEAAQMRKLEAIVWPAIAEEVQKQIDAVKSGIVVIEAAIMLEAGWDKIVDQVWCFIIPPKVAIERMVNTRSLTEEEAKKRLAAQMSNEERIKRVKKVFWTDKEVEVLEEKMKVEWEKLNRTRLPAYGVAYLPKAGVNEFIAKMEDRVEKGVYYISPTIPTIKQLGDLYNRILSVAPTHIESMILLPTKNVRAICEQFETLDNGDFEIVSPYQHEHLCVEPMLTVSDQSNPSYQADKTYQKVCVGGTFDRLHMGHYLLLSSVICSASRSSKAIFVCGMTDTSLQSSKAYKELIEPLETRCQAVQKFVDRFNIGRTIPHPTIEFHTLQDPFGPTIVDAEIGVLCVSEETKKGGEKINQIRSEKNLPQLDIVVVPELKAANASTKLSSSALRQEAAVRSRL